MSHFRKECPPKVQQQQEKALTSTIFILRNIGPLGFLLKDETNGADVKVLLGNPHRCTCSGFQRDKDLCVHICWVLMRRFRLHKDDILAYQLGLSNYDINYIVQKFHETSPKANLPKPELPETGNNCETVNQKIVLPDDICPICQENLLEKHWPITFCQYSCGNNVHIRCMKIWADHQEKSSDSPNNEVIVKCPYCRGKFGLLEQLKADFKHDPTRNVNSSKTTAEAKENLESGDPEATKRKSCQVSKDQLEKLMQTLAIQKLTKTCGPVKLRYQCCLCLQHFRENDIVSRLSCSHLFHKRCLRKWFMEGNVQCPIDERSITEQHKSIPTRTSTHRLTESTNKPLLTINGSTIRSVRLPPILNRTSRNQSEIMKNNLASLTSTFISPNKQPFNSRKYFSTVANNKLPVLKHKLAPISKHLGEMKPMENDASDMKKTLYNGLNNFVLSGRKLEQKPHYSH